MYFPFSRRSIELIAALAMLLGVASAAIAADVAMPTKAPYNFTTYIWATSLNGSVKGRTTDIDASFFDILDHTQFPKGLFQLAAFGEARYGRFGLLADIAYMKLGLGASLERSRGVDEITARF